MRIGALEAGGTKMVCAVGREDGTILERKVFPTLRPEQTMPELIGYFQQAGVEALGAACFGPLDLDKTSDTYGYITSTPKAGWQDYPIWHILRSALQVPVGFDTDVNGSVLGEAAYGALRGVETGMYITIGTGIGAGILANGRVLHGMQHPEAGHILLSRHPQDPYEGTCVCHKNCFEGLAAGPALEKRWGKRAEELADIDKVWELEAYYIGQALADYVMLLSPQKIVLGGGVMHQETLLPRIHRQVREQLGGYIRTWQMEHLEQYIVRSELGEDQGILGALKLGQEAARTV